MAAPALIAALLLPACSNDIVGSAGSFGTGPGENGIVTDSTTYSLQAGSFGWEGRIGFVFTNRSNRPISLLNCSGGFNLRLEAWNGEQWEFAWSPRLLSCLSPPIETLPGETREFVLSLLGVFPEGNAEGIDGTYRLVIMAAYWDYNPDGPPYGEVPPLRYRVSNSFQLRAL